MPLTIYHRVLSAVACFSTLLAMTAAFGALTEDQFGQCHEWAIWGCLNIPGFGEEHERWIEILAPLRTAWVAFTRVGSDPRRTR